jgi:hypothetical protein
MSMGGNGARRKTGVTLIALLLAIGGAFGLVFAFTGQVNLLLAGQFKLAALDGLFVLLFGWSAWIGYELWQGKPYAFRMAKLILVGQIPNFTVPGFSFEGFITGGRVYFMVGSCTPSLQFGFNLQSFIHFTISPDIDCWRIGVNLLAIASLAYLTKLSAEKAPAVDKFGLL